jgi:hypothetical protein
MKNIKVIQHINGIEHITDKLLQTKSLEFTYESLVIFEASLTLIVDSSDEVILQLLTWGREFYMQFYIWPLDSVAKLFF